MRILHTSDWHLGRSFHGANMIPAQEAFIRQLVETVRSQKVDVVLISGDVYDRALPNVDVVRLLDQALVELRRAGAIVILSSGNHDSATRLGFASSVMAAGGVHIRASLDALEKPVELDLGEGAALAIYALPYLEPRIVATALGVDEPGHTAVTRAALTRVREDLERRRAERSAAGLGPLLVLVMAHSFVSSGVCAESERSLGVGSLGVVPLELFDGFDYAALGHLHGRQRLSDIVRYSGSPLAYSFGEARQEKGGWLLHWGDQGLQEVQPVSWAPLKELAILKGRLEDLLSDPAHEDAESAYCQITLTDPERPASAMERLRERFPDTLVLSHEPEQAAFRAVQSYRERVAGARDDVELVSGFLELVRQRSASAEEREDITEALERARLQEHSA